MTRSLIVGVDDTDDSRNALARGAEWAGAAPSQSTPQNQRSAEVAALAQLTERAGFDLARHTQVRVR